ncbi:TPA: RHS repeat protein [Proteus mirabilis]|uniref:RHS repeat-associated core domain-containing protein n=4 Tax=Proteus mirabilis TaxID=584 RepID=UPI0038CB8DAD|nr:RHS repeat protein [Proteus mirabilis]HCT1962636.1 RHS repeat protein [Proteus mirabilis]
MGNEFFAAKQGDKLMHSSIFADIVCGVVKGAVYAAIGTAAVALTIGTGGMATAAGAAIFAGAGLAAGFTIGGLIDDAADWVADGIDSLFGLSNPDGEIDTGSKNVRVKGKGAARAAGKLPSPVLLASIAADNTPPKEEKGTEIALRVLKNTAMMTTGAFSLLAGKVLGSQTNNAAPIALDPSAFPEYPSPEQGFFDSILSPVKAAKHPNAEPMPLDTITCDKWHCASAPYFLAEGSKKVQINSQPACRNGDRSTCEAKISDTQEKGIVRIGGGSVVVRDIMSGRNPFAEMFGEILGGLAVGAASTLFRRGGLKAIKQCLNSVGCTLVSEIASTAVGSMVVASVTQAFNSVRHPVHAATGAKVLNGEDDTDFIIDGVYPLVWSRIYQSRNTGENRLGRGWAMPFDVFLTIDDTGKGLENENIYYHDMSGRRLALGKIALGQKVFYQDEGFTVYRTTNNLFLVESAEGDYQFFEANPHKINTLRLMKSADRHNNALHYRYANDGELVQIHDDAYLTDIRLHYDEITQRLQSVTRHQGQEEKTLVTYTYDAQQRLVQVTNADKRVTRRFGWDDESGLMAMHQYATGVSSHYRWQRFDAFTIEDNEPEWRVVEHWLKDGKRCLEHTELTYDLAQRTLTTVETGGETTFRRWNEQQQIIEYTNALNETWWFEWDTSRLLTKAIAPDGSEWGYTYDERGNLTQSTDPEQQSTCYDWDKDFAFPTAQTLPNGAAWHWEYNEHGDIRRVIDPLGHITRLAWDDQGLCLGQVDAKGNETHYRYNARGQLIEQRDCSGYPTTLTYDDWGQLRSLTNAQNETTTYTFSEAGLLLTERLPDGTENRYDYDATGQLVGITDAGERHILLRRNRRGQVIARRDPAGHWLHFHYDTFGRMQALENEQGEQYRFEYDALHRLTDEHDLIGQQKHYQYDVMGNVTQIKTTPGPSIDTPMPLSPQVTTFGYDKVGRLLFRENADYRTEYLYQPFSVTLRRVPMAIWHEAERTGTTARVEYQDALTFTYDKVGQLVREASARGDYQHHYDVLGNITRTELPHQRAFEYLYYGSGHLQQMQWRDNAQLTVLAEYQRDRLHRETLRTSGALDNETGYDCRGRITHQVARQMNASQFVTPVIDRRYRWDKRNQLIERSVSYGQTGEVFTAGHWYYHSYQYDPLGQLTAHLGSVQTEHFLYDAAANLLTRPHTKAPHNQVQGSDKYDYRYDGFDRMVSRYEKGSSSGQRYHYDSDHRIIAVDIDQGPLGYQRAEYRYDILGRRIEKRLWKASAIANTVTYHQHEPDEVYTFGWVGMRLVSEHSSAAPHTTVYHAYNDQSYTPLARIECTDNPLNPQRAIYYTHSSLSGLPEALTNSEGEIVWQGQYSAWGHLQRQTRPTSTFNREQNLRFQGQYFDKETGLHYNTFRYYAPDLGRFTQQDPIGLAGGINLYAYAPDPLTWVDPLGLSCRNNYLGRTPGKNSRTGREVIARMRRDGDVLDVNGQTIFKASDGNWYPLREADMSHKTDAVTWWNNTGRYLGPKSKSVRNWMLDSKNYYLDHYSLNRSAGAQIGQVYLPPVLPIQPPIVK